MLARDGVSQLIGMGFVDTAFSSPDPDDFNLETTARDILYLPNRNAAAASARYALVKRGMDVAVSAALLVLTFPLLLLIAATVRLSSKGPVIFSQDRLTEGGKVFRMLKFRSMQVNAESETGPVWAAAADPRITKIGKLLRLTHLDELPQLVNVLQGEMSLIGPRPERPEIAKELKLQLPAFDRRLEVKGGITGLAQVTSGYASSLQSYRRKLSLDLYYVKHQSLKMDLVIALKTVAVLFTGSRAH